MRKYRDSLKFSRQDAIWWGVVVGMLVGCRLIGSTGVEWYNYRQAIFSGFQGAQGVANPPYTAVLLYPLGLLPPALGGELFIVINVLAVALACKLVGGNRWGVLLSFPFVWLVWYAQIDGLVALGVGLGYWAIQHEKPYWVGVSCLLLGIKPQVGGILALYYLWKAASARALVLPSLVALISFIAFGFWPIAYVHRLISLEDLTLFTEQGTNIGLFPWGALSWIVLLFGTYSFRQRVMLILCATMLSSPYMAHYSTVSLLIFDLPKLLYFFFSAPFILPLPWGAIAVTSGVVLVIAFLFVLRWLPTSNVTRHLG